MNREATLVREIIDLTKEGKLEWRNVSPGRYTEFIFQAPFAYQAFLTEFLRKKIEYQLLIVHKKYPTENTDFDVIEERHRTELLILREGRLVSTITDYIVDDRLILELAEEVDQNNDDIKELFE